MEGVAVGSGGSNDNSGGGSDTGNNSPDSNQ